jgi:hypothetical protein
VLHAFNGNEPSSTGLAKPRLCTASHKEPSSYEWWRSTRAARRVCLGHGQLALTHFIYRIEILEFRAEFRAIKFGDWCFVSKTQSFSVHPVGLEPTTFGSEVPWRIVDAFRLAFESLFF